VPGRVVLASYTRKRDDGGTKHWTHGRGNDRTKNKKLWGETSTRIGREEPSRLLKIWGVKSLKKRCQKNKGSLSIKQLHSVYCKSGLSRAWSEVHSVAFKVEERGGTDHFKFPKWSRRGKARRTTKQQADGLSSWREKLKRKKPEGGGTKRLPPSTNQKILVRV